MTAATLRLYRGRSDAPGQLIAPGDRLAIDGAVETAAGRVYRRLVYLKIPSDGIAGGVLLEQPRICGSFTATTLTLSRNSALLREPWQWRENKVEVHLHRPWHLREVRTGTPATVQLFRVDGDAIADQATAEINSAQTIATEFVSQHFAMDSKASTVTGFGEILINSGGSSGAPARAEAREVGAGGGVKVQSEAVAHSLHAAFHGFTSLLLNSYPTTPRVSIPADLNAEPAELVQDGNDIALDLLWQQAGELRTGGESDLGSALESVLLPKLGAAFAQLGGSGGALWVPLVLDSDTPCNWTLNAIDLPYRFYLDRFQDASAKFVMDFSDRNGRPQVLPLLIPRGDVTHASVRIDIGNRDRLGDAGGAAGGASAKGLLLDGEFWYAARIIPPRAGFYGAVAVSISLLSPQLELEAVIVEAALSPGGEALGVARGGDDRRAASQWLTLAFEPLRLDATEYWLRLKAGSGRCVWHCRDSAAGEVKKGSQLAPAEAPRSLARLAPVIRLYPLDYSPRPNSPLFTLLADEAPLGLIADDDNFYRAQTPADLNGAGALRVRQIARGKLIFSRPKIEYLPGGQAE